MTLTTLSLGELMNRELARRQPMLGSWLIQRSFGMVHAPAGVGKSMLCLAIAQAIAGGGSILGWKSDQPRAVLYVDAEMELVDLQDRARRLQNSIEDLQVDSMLDNLHFLPRSGQHADVEFPSIDDEDPGGGHDQIRGLAKARGVELVILDNLSMLADINDENKASEFNSVMRLGQSLRHDGIAVLLVHHSGKGKAESRNSFRGSSKMDAPLDYRIGLSPPRKPLKDQGTAFHLTFHKFRGLVADDVRDLEVHLHSGNGGSGWTVNNDEKLHDALRLSEELKTGQYRTQKDLAAALGWSTAKVSKVKKIAVDDGLLTDDEVRGHLDAAQWGFGETA